VGHMAENDQLLRVLVDVRVVSFGFVRAHVTDLGITYSLNWRVGFNFVYPSPRTEQICTGHVT